MMEKTKTETNHSKVLELRKLHQPVFEALGVPGALYFPKMFYRPSGKEELYVSFFKSELQRGQDLYTEMTDREFVSEDPSRQLYRWKYDPQWADNYEHTQDPDKPIRYLVPVSELQRITSAEDMAGDTTASDCISDDCSMSEMSMRDLLAIIQGVPISSKKWLNDAISECIRYKQPRTPNWPG